MSRNRNLRLATLVALSLHLVAASLGAQTFFASCNSLTVDDFETNNPAGVMPVPNFPVPYLPAGPITGSGWGFWFPNDGPQLADFDLIDGNGTSLLWRPQPGGGLAILNLRALAPPTSAGGMVVWRFRAMWEYRVGGIAPPPLYVEQFRVGLGGVKSQHGCIPGTSGPGPEYLGFSSQTTACVTPPCPPNPQQLVLGQFEGGGWPLRIFAQTPAQIDAARLTLPAGAPPGIYDFEVRVDLDLGTVDVYMSRDGMPAVDVWGYRMVFGINCGGAQLPTRFLNVSHLTFDSDGLNNVGGVPNISDYFRMDDVVIEHYTPADVQSCADTYHNDAVDVVDLLMILQQSVGLTSDPTVAALGDVDRDGDVDILDVLRVAQFMNGDPVPLLCQPGAVPAC